MEFENESVFEPDASEIAAAWDDEGKTTDNFGEESDADQQKETKSEEPGQEEQDKATEATATDKPEDKQTEADQPLTFTLKHLDETRTVDKDEVIKLAQQGMDYERVRTERDQLREYRKENDIYAKFIKERAEQNGLTPQAFMDGIYKSELMSKGANEQTAIERIALEKQKAELSVQKAALTEAEVKQKAESERAAREAEGKNLQEQKKQADMTRFLQKYPNVKADTIPKEVWDAVKAGEPLTVAYTEYRNKQLEAENEALKQNQKNQQTTTGSLHTKGQGFESLIDKYWYDD